MALDNHVSSNEVPTTSKLPPSTLLLFTSLYRYHTIKVTTLKTLVLVLPTSIRAQLCLVFCQVIIDPLTSAMINENSQCDVNAAEDEEVKDVFTKLPEDVVDRIISFLSINDLIKMSIVSKSWRYLWKTCQNFDFDLHCLYSEAETSISLTSKQNYLPYAKWVNRILSTHHRNNIKSFKIRTYSNCKYNAYIDQWIGSAFQKQVRSLVILNTPSSKTELDQVSSGKYILPTWFSLQDAKFLTQLTLGNICLGSFEVNCVNNVTTLALDNVFVSDNWVHKMLQNSVHLKQLSLHGCTSLSLTKLVIPSHIELEQLSLLDGLKYLREVVIENGRGLESFECSLKIIIKSFSFENVRNTSSVPV